MKKRGDALLGSAGGLRGADGEAFKQIRILRESEIVNIVVGDILDGTTSSEKLVAHVVLVLKRNKVCNIDRIVAFVQNQGGIRLSAPGEMS